MDAKRQPFSATLVLHAFEVARELALGSLRFNLSSNYSLLITMHHWIPFLTVEDDATIILPTVYFLLPTNHEPLAANH